MGEIGRNTAGLVLALALSAPGSARDSSMLERGRYLVHAGGCITCHTAENGAVLAGGRALESPFGTFYSPNITPDEDTGIGGWSDDDFVNAFHLGVNPEGEHYFPAFPYPSYTGLSLADLLAMKAYLFSLEPVRNESRAHELPWFMRSRLAAGTWKAIYFRPGRFGPDPDRSAEWNRGAYLVRHLGHCGECHTPRNALGAPDIDRELAGGRISEDASAPDITPNPETGIGRWSTDDIEFFLELGMLPDGDFVGGEMSAVIDDNTSQLTAEDRRAIAAYLKSLPESP